VLFHVETDRCDDAENHGGRRVTLQKHSKRLTETNLNRRPVSVLDLPSDRETSIASLLMTPRTYRAPRAEKEKL